MNEVKTTLKRLAVYYLLLVVNIIPLGVIPDVFPIRNLSTVYLLILSVGLVLYYYHRVTPSGTLSALVKSLSVMALLLILLRGIKYGALSGIGVLARHTWYLYYVPILLLPLVLFYISLLVSNKKLPKLWFIPLALTVVFILLVLTNDLHQQAFVFKEDFADWDGDYTHGWLFYVVNVWQSALYLAAIIILIFKCRVGSARKRAWLILIPVGIGVVLLSLLLADKRPVINGTPIFEFPEAHIFTAAALIECCMQLGLIPTNTDYGKLFKNLSISAQIADKKGNPVYSSSSAVPLTQKQFLSDSGSRIGEHTVLHKMSVAGGYGFWQVDMSEIDRLNDELTETKESLAEETELIRLRNELKEKQTKIYERTLMYDSIAKRTQRQSQAISRFAEAARKESDATQKDAYRRRIAFLGAYIKRYANLMLLSQENDVIEVGELILSFSEVLRYLNYCGIPSECIGGVERTLDAKAALMIFEAFETLIEENYSRLNGVFVNVTAKEDLIFKMTFENLDATLSSTLTEELSNVGVSTNVKREDEVAYLSFTIGKGGSV